MSFTRRLSRSPPPHLIVSKLVVIAPEYAGEARLPGQFDELKAFEMFPGFVRQQGQKEGQRRLTELGSLAGKDSHNSGLPPSPDPPGPRPAD